MPTFNWLFDVLVLCPATLEPKHLTCLCIIENLLVVEIRAEICLMAVNAKVYAGSILKDIELGVATVAENGALVFWDKVFCAKVWFLLSVHDLLLWLLNAFLF